MKTTFIFRTDDSRLSRHNEYEVKILRELTKEEADEEVGTMYKVKRIDTDDTFDAFEDELTSFLLITELIEIYNEIDMQCISETDTVKMESIKDIFINHGLDKESLD